MKEYAFGDTRVEVDEQATRDYYACAPVMDRLSEFHSKFVEMAKRRELPADMLELLDKLSVPPEKAVYVDRWYETDTDAYWYVHYRIAGRILNEPELQELRLPQKKKGFKKFTALLGVLLGREPAMEKVLVPATLYSELEGGSYMECSRPHGKAATAAADLPAPCFDFIFHIYVHL